MEFNPKIFIGLVVAVLVIMFGIVKFATSSMSFAQDDRVPSAVVTPFPAAGGGAGQAVGSGAPARPQESVKYVDGSPLAYLDCIYERSTVNSLMILRPIGNEGAVRVSIDGREWVCTVRDE